VRHLFIIDSINRLTQKNYLISFDNLNKENLAGPLINDLVTELFIARPRLNKHE